MVLLFYTISEVYTIFGMVSPLQKYWHLPIFTPRRQGTIFGTTELNFRVRDGNGWTLCVIDTNLIVADFMAPPTGLEPVTS